MCVVCVQSAISIQNNFFFREKCKLDLNGMACMSDDHHLELPLHLTYGQSSATCKEISLMDSESNNSKHELE